jgi:diacylglycerol kinase (ATP)
MTFPLIIVNPTSAAGATRDLWLGMASDMRTHFGPFSSVFTQKQGDAYQIAKVESKPGRLIIACGGDGTINEVANGILDSGVGAELGILPSGTGGDFRRTLGIPKRMADIALALRRGETKVIDVGRVTYVNHKNEADSRYFVNVSSFGMSGKVIERVKQQSADQNLVSTTRLLGGKLSFALATLQTTLSFHKPTVVVQLDDEEERQLKVVNFCVANARYFGGGMKVAPNAKLNDGVFDIVVFGDLSTVDMLTSAHRLYTGTHLGLQEVHHAFAKRIYARSVDAKLINVEIDGELLGYLPAKFEIVPNALRVRFNVRQT